LHVLARVWSCEAGSAGVGAGVCAGSTALMCAGLPACLPAVIKLVDIKG
jgi:hypothetical protein